MKDLGKLRSLSLAEVFTEGEAVDFTPWLSDNLDRLATELGFELESEATEVQVGTFKADITAKTTDGRLVVIENQFRNTDHSHLGQLLTYAAGLKADIVIWIAEKIREEHRAAVDWLNEKTVDADIFAVEARAVQIDDSRPALNWDVVSSPNTWSRTTQRIRDARQSTPADKLRVRYWGAVNEAIENSGAGLFGFRPRGDSWQGGSIGSSAVWLTTVINLRDHWVRVEIYLSDDDSREWFENLQQQKEGIETDLGYALDWDPMDNRKACRISVTLNADPSEEANWAQQHEWIIQRRLDLERVFRPIVRTIRDAT